MGKTRQNPQKASTQKKNLVRKNYTQTVPSKKLPDGRKFWEKPSYSREADPPWATPM